MPLLIPYFSIHAQIDAQHNKIRTVVIDAGHGGKDPGAVGKYAKEKDVVLAIALKTGKYIEEKFPDVKVIYTRDSDVFIGLHERTQIANKANADLFISIHANSNPNTAAIGAETYVMGLHKSQENLEVAKKENSAIVLEDNYKTRYEGFDPNDVESYIMLSLMQNTYLDQSLNAASLIQTQFRDRANRKDRGVKQAGFLVLWETTMPSVLVEVGFISNLEEEKYIASESGQDYLASAIFRAFRGYKEYIEGTSFAPEPLVVTQTPPIEETKIPDSKPVLPDTNQNLYRPKNTAQTTETTSTQVTFKVQILVSEKPIDTSDKIFGGLSPVHEIQINGKYKYLAGESSTYQEALEYSKEIKKKYPDAFIVAVSNGKIIPLSEALEMVKTN